MVLCLNKMLISKLCLFLLLVICRAERVKHEGASLATETQASKKDSQVRVRESSRVFGHVNVESVRVFGVEADKDGKCRDVMHKVRAYLKADDAEGRSDAVESKEEADILSGEKDSKVLDEILDVISRQDLERELTVGEVVTTNDLNHLVECETNQSSVRLEEMSAKDAQLEEDEDILEGDILVPKGTGAESFVQMNSSDDSRGTLEWAGRLWSGGDVPYCFHSAVNRFEKDAFRKAVADYTQNSCVKWREIEASTDKRCAEKPSVMVKNNKPGCNSHIGMQFTWVNSQRLNLEQGCHVHGVILHEMGHAIGLAHEHERYDRDKYINVHWENIKPEFKFAFKKRFSASTSDPYDYKSLMHYGNYEFSNGGGPTITDTKGQNVKGMGQRARFDEQDWAQINRMYGCSRR
eukprot:TRINITY_DN51895_c0_g1_i1.p1 TRINITY_DN51895_c0_g1~~TRINITY_DN51895_c0_g1_i1.p1  ORF type:complete len:408 (+),score=59.17 TRINITY_DN51895_c0_g1_i1:107-1330(+)